MDAELIGAEKMIITDKTELREIIFADVSKEELEDLHDSYLIQQIVKKLCIKEAWEEAKHETRLVAHFNYFIWKDQIRILLAELFRNWLVHLFYSPKNKNNFFSLLQRLLKKTTPSYISNN
tara:strand:- start:9540 stop:9902 length:363 start_codon:yes stop_codon:yes gene_type:complete